MHYLCSVEYQEREREREKENIVLSINWEI